MTTTNYIHFRNFSIMFVQYLKCKKNVARQPVTTSSMPKIEREKYEKKTIEND